MPGPRHTTGRTRAKSAISKSKPSLKKSNAIGYIKRQSQKAKNRSNIEDVYEYEPGKARRSNVRLELDREEAKEYGVGPDGDLEDGVDREALRARLIGESEEDEVIASGDDEEIDSDAAFEESDEDRFAGFFSNKKGKGKAKLSRKTPTVRFADVDLDENSGLLEGDQVKNVDEGGEDEDEGDDMEEGDDDQFINLADVLDGKGEIYTGDKEDSVPKPSTSKSTPPVRGSGADDGDEDMDDEGKGDDDDDDDDGDDDDDDEESEEEKLDFTPSDDDATPHALDELDNFIASLDTAGKKRKAQERDEATASNGPKRKKRHIIKERTEAGAENEFRAQSSGPKLRLEDLLAPLGSQSSALQALKKSTKALTSNSSKFSKALSAPLPQRTQERLDREAAYQQTKEEVGKWKDTINRIREAEHLSFPLQGNNNMGRSSTLELVAKFKPSNDLESSIDALLKAANMQDEAELLRTEENILKANKLTLEEVAQRRSELRKMRELMFRAELKARRINKIKSKTYRRLKRKEKDRISQLSNEADGDDEEDEEQRLTRERERAMERATLRHKNTGKWARQLKARGDAIGEDERWKMEEMLTRGEKLRQKIQGSGSNESESNDDTSDEDEGDGESTIQRIKKSAFDELQRVDEKDKELETSTENEKRSVFNMKFMKEAMAREKAKADQMAGDFLRELAGSSDTAGEDDAKNSEKDQDGVQEDSTSGVVTQRVGGRMVFKPGAQVMLARSMGSLASDTSSVTLKSTDILSPISPAIVPPNQTPLVVDDVLPSPVSPIWQSNSPVEDSNPWLTRPDAIKAISKSSHKNEIVISKDSKAPEKSKNKLRKLARKHAEEQEKAKDDATLEIEAEKALTLTASSKALNLAPDGIRRGNISNITAGWKVKDQDSASSHTVPAQDNEGDILNDSDADSEIEAQVQALDAKNKGIKAFEQRDLVALAFAGDNVVQQFEETKLREVAADAPKAVDTTIPGWGSWGGTGVRKAPPKPSRVKTIPGIDPATRADYNKKHIIISERRDKKAAKYTIKDLPFPYTSKAQFERSMERPLGTEWNTRVGFQRATLPRVVSKPGVVIMPLKKFS